MTNGFDFDLWIFKVKCDLELWPHTWPWPWIFMRKFWNSCISERKGRLTLNKGGWIRSFMTMTIWWPRSGVKDLPDSDRGDFWCWHAVDSSGLSLKPHLTGINESKTIQYIKGQNDINSETVFSGFNIFRSDIFKGILLNENFPVWNKIPLKYVRV